MPLGVSVRIKLVDKLSTGLGRINARFDRLEKVVKRTNREFISFGKRLDRFSGKARGVGRNMSLGITLPILGIGAAMIKAAVTAEETQNKFDVVFSRISGRANNMSKELSGSFGLSVQESQKLLSGTGDLLTGFGFTQEAALSLSGQVQRLAVDLGSLNDLPTEQASLALTKALLGENESVKSLGISILEKDVKAKIKAMEVAGKFTDETDRQKKALATLQIAIDQSGNAIGDWARSQDSVANKTKEMMSRLADLSVQFGTILLPVVSKVVGGLTIMANVFSKMPKGVKTVIVAMAAFAAVIGPLIFLAGAMASGLSAIMTIVPLLSLSIFAGLIPAITGMAAALFATGIPQVIIGITLLIAGIVFLAKNFQRIKTFARNAFLPIIGFVDFLIKKLDNISPILGNIARVFKALVLTSIKEVLSVVELLADAVSGIFDTVNPFGSDAPTPSTSAASAGAAGVGGAAAPINNASQINIGINVDKGGNVKGTTVDSTNTTSRVRVINKGPMVPVMGFG